MLGTLKHQNQESLVTSFLCCETTVKFKFLVCVIKFQLKHPVKCAWSTTYEQIRQNCVNFGPKCSPEIQNVPQPVSLETLYAWGTNSNITQTSFLCQTKVFKFQIHSKIASFDQQKCKIFEEVQTATMFCFILYGWFPDLWWGSGCLWIAGEGWIAN